MIQSQLSRGLMAGVLLLAGACGSSMLAGKLTTRLLSVDPRGGDVDVSVAPGIVLMFSHSMMSGMEQYLALHEGSVSGPTIPMNCNWSDAQKTLSCHPGSPLAPATSYTIHMGGGMMDADGQGVDLESHGVGMGGQWASGGMMGGQNGMMGSGWMNSNGSYGMVFGFTTR